MKLVPYLFFDGNLEEAFRYYEKHLGGKVTALMRHEGTPAEDAVPKEWKYKIIHGCLQVGDATLMASDAPPGRFNKPQGFSVSIQLDDPGEAERTFYALADGGEVRMPFEETFWAKRFGMCVDRFGTPWMVNCGNKAVS